MRVRHDLHTHSTYSDGWDLREMADAAASAGLEAMGVADHCPIGPDRFGRREQYDMETRYEERRTDLFAVARETDVALLDAAEVNYDPDKEKAIAAFLEEAGFAYTIGSVHFADAYDVVHPACTDASKERRQAAVDAYVDWQHALITSDLFDVVGHLDVVQRVPALRGLMDRADYVRLAEALAESQTVPEINAGRLDRAYGTIHPAPERLSIFADRGVEFVVGTDAHAPDQLRNRIALLEETLDTVPVTIRAMPPVMAEL